MNDSKVKIQLRIFRYSSIWVLVYLFTGLFFIGHLKAEDIRCSEIFSTSYTVTIDSSNEIDSFFTSNTSSSYPKYSLNDLSYFDLSTDQAKMSSLFSLAHYIPHMFTKYPDIASNFTLLDKQNRVVDYLKKIPSYESTLLNRRIYTQITIHSTPTSNRTVYSISPDSLKLWRQKLNESLYYTFTDNNNSVEELIAHYLKLYISLKTTSSALIAGIVSFLTPDQKTEFLSKTSTPKDRINWIKLNLEDDFPSSFKKANFNFLQTSSTKDNVIRILSIEHKLASLLILYLALLDYGDMSKLKLNKETLDNFGILSFSELIFDTLLKKDYLEKNLSDLLSDLKSKFSLEFNDKKLLVTLINSILVELKPYTQKTMFSEQKSIDIILKEVPPKIAVFRGMMGGDCSTSLSFPYPNDPHERVFFIYNTEGDPLGYLSATEVESPIGKILYLITISGPRISTLMAESIIEALNSLKSKLNVSYIGFPPDRLLASLINYSEIRDAYSKKYSLDQVNISYQNRDIRSYIEKFHESNSAQYDHQANNTVANLYIPSSESSLSILSTISSVNPNALTHLSGNFNSVSGRIAYTIFKLLAEYKVFSREYLESSYLLNNVYTDSEMIDIVFNKDRLSKAEYLNKISEIFFSGLKTIPDDKIPQEAILRFSDEINSHDYKSISMIYVDSFIYEDSTEIITQKIKDYTSKTNYIDPLDHDLVLLYSLIKDGNIAIKNICYSLLFFDHTTLKIRETYNLYKVEADNKLTIIADNLDNIPTLVPFRITTYYSSNELFFIISKNNSKALLSSIGNFVIHFGLYNTIIPVNSLHLIVSNGIKYGVIDYYGSHVGGLQYDYLEVDENSNIVYYDPDGTKHQAYTSFYYY